MSLVPLARALSRLGAASRTRATILIREGQVRVDGRVIRDPWFPVPVTRAKIDINGEVCEPPAWRCILFHKPKGVVTTTRDPEGRKTVFDVLGPSGIGLRAVGRLDLASTGLLLLTNDAHLADWLTDPDNAIPRLYVIAVRGRVTQDDVSQLTAGIADSRGRVSASAVTISKASTRESHLLIELRQGRNREIRRLFTGLNHEVTRLKRVAFGGLELGAIPPGAWRELQPDEFRRAFGPEVPLAAGRRRSKHDDERRHPRSP